MVFGIDNAGNPTGVHSKTVETTLNQLSNLARAALEPTLSLASGADCTPCERTKTVFYRHPPISPVARTTL